ncbi:MAG: dihydrofolate reductase [Chlamydiales bacterium]|nr:dihydrofolate reductase [Chlamydiales bacterium]
MPLLPKFTAIAACDPNGIMGRDGTLPWHYPEDLHHFRRSTLGHVMVMGYKTYLSMPPRAFEGRTSFVFTRSNSVDPAHATPVGGLEELAKAYSENRHLLEKTQFVIGGSEIFDLFFNESLIEYALITHVEKSYPGETLFPLKFLESALQESSEHLEELSIAKYKISYRSPKPSGSL